MLPWIVLPLVTAASGEGGRLRAAARSGLAIACCGGINATATVAVLVVPVVYVLTRPRGTFRARMLAWWSVCAGAATAWWLAPLLLTGTYGFSWLTYTEKAETTTGPTGLINVLRGAERWVNYLIVDGQVWWPVGHGLSLGPLPILCTGVVAALGLAGLLSRLLPERTFLLLTLLAGLAILSMGHISDIPGPFADRLRDLLDGPLAPLRNLHKFDAVVRLPLALGLAHVLVAAARRAREARGAQRRGSDVRSLSGGAARRPGRRRGRSSACPWPPPSRSAASASPPPRTA
nr:alpha-(1->3)-arabinofuranosyltransferase family protein [Actinomadura madurae]